MQRKLLKELDEFGGVWSFSGVILEHEFCDFLHLLAVPPFDVGQLDETLLETREKFAKDFAPLLRANDDAVKRAEFAQKDTQTPDVSREVVIISTENLGGHISRCSYARLCPLATLDVDGPADSEVSDFDRFRGSVEEDILWFNIAMNYFRRMDYSHRLTELNHP